MSAFDDKTMDLNFGTGEGDKLRETVKRMGEFIAYFEVAERRMSEWKRDLEQQVAANQGHIQQQLQDIRLCINELQEIMTEAGAARWRIAAESALQQGKNHLHTLEQIGNQHLGQLEHNLDELQSLAKKSFDRLDRASAYTIKNISDAISSFRINDFQRLTEQSCAIVEDTSNLAVTKLQQTVKWFHWKNLALAATIAIFSTLSIGLYLNDEMPWEIHKHVAEQRHYGQALMNSWPALTEQERQRIIRHSKDKLQQA